MPIWMKICISVVIEFFCNISCRTGQTLQLAVVCSAAVTRLQTVLFFLSVIVQPQPEMCAAAVCSRSCALNIEKRNWSLSINLIMQVLINTNTKVGISTTIFSNDPATATAPTVIYRLNSCTTMLLSANCHISLTLALYTDSLEQNLKSSPSPQSS